MRIDKWKDRLQYLYKVDSKQPKRLLKIIVVICFFILSWTQLELSSMMYDSWEQLLQIERKWILINILSDCIVCLLIYVLVNSFWKSCAVYSILITLISIVNYYTIKFHGMPLAFSELRNFKTALNVIAGYSFDLKEISSLLAIFAVEIVMIWQIRRLTIKAGNKRKIRNILIRDIGICCISFLIVYILYIAENPIVDVTLGWSWKETYRQYGYTACTISRAVASFDNIIKEPDGYQREYVDDIEIVKQTSDGTQEEFPDIIVILNETFYDLSLIADIKTDVPYLENINSMDNAITGYANVPSVGGGTNSSEYELLTSNSLQLMPGIIPFNVIDMKGANSIVSHLKQLGYYTVGTHSEPALNYNRRNAYVDMGFDQTYFDEDFVDKTYYDNRWFESDSCLYNNLLAWMEGYDRSPHFTYLLTIQNHGEWERNEQESDIVHALNDFGEYDEKVDEFLSCISLSDLAFKDFTDKLQDLDRDVIVCMVGDHCPSFAESIVDEKYMADSEFLLTNTPFIIWANYDIEEQNIGTISMNYLMPTLLEIAGVNLSPYYRYMLDLREDVPILTSRNVYYDKDIVQYPYGVSSDYSERINNYFYLEYNNLQADREQSLFDAY